MHDKINHSILQLIENARTAQKEIEALENKLSTLTRPTLSDTSQLPQIYAHVQSQMEGEELREQRLCFVFIATCLYSPVSIYGNYPMKSGLRRAIGSIIHRCNSEISEMLAVSKFRYDQLAGFREQIGKIFTQIEK